VQPLNACKCWLVCSALRTVVTKKLSTHELDDTSSKQGSATSFCEKGNEPSNAGRLTYFMSQGNIKC